MKKLLSILLIIVMCVSFAGCENVNTTVKKQPEEPIFDYHLPEWLVWGMKEGEVRQNLNELIIEYGDLICFWQDEQYRNCRVREYYGFSKDNSLNYMGYYFEFDMTTLNRENTYYEIFSECREKMLEEYGAPIIDEEEWINERYKGDEYMMFKAIEDGDYTAKIVWQLDGYYCSIEVKNEIIIRYSTDKNEI